MDSSLLMEEQKARDELNEYTNYLIRTGATSAISIFDHRLNSLKERLWEIEKKTGSRRIVHDEDEPLKPKKQDYNYDDHADFYNHFFNSSSKFRY